MSFRKARTRTLIQVGGLVEKAGLLQALNIQLGDDLQQNSECFENTAILMGALIDACKALHTNDRHAQKILWAEVGKKMLKQRDKT